MMLDEEAATPIPTNNIIDPLSGFSIMVPVTEQGWPLWWVQMPDYYESILRLREANNITVDDKLDEYMAYLEELKNENA